MSLMQASVKLELTTTNAWTRIFQPRQLKIDEDQSSYDAIAITTTDASELTILNSADGWAFFQNVSTASAVIDIGADSSGVIKAFGRLKQNEWGVFPVVSGTTYMAQAESGTGRLYYGLYGTASISPSTVIPPAGFGWNAFTAAQWDTFAPDEWDNFTA